MKAFVLDPPRCTGCEACRVACSIENRVPMERSWRTVHHVNPEHRPELPSFHLSLACNHCARPACLEGCPASAYAKDPATGAVLLDDARCIGCRYCTWVCPYDAPRFDPGRRVMAKCTFCHPRLQEGKVPACAAACPTGALAVEDQVPGWPEPVFPGLYPGGLGPSLRIVHGADQGRPAMAESCTPEAASWVAPAAVEPVRKISLRSEWTLWLFTLAATVLAGLHLGWTLGGPRLLPAWATLALGGAAAVLSASHLGRPERAWRALSNLRSSWLSREVLAFSIFLPLAALAQLLDRRGPVAWLGAAAGLVLLFAMDRLYQVAERRPAWKLRSSDVLPAGLQLAALAAGAAIPLAVLAILRAALYLPGQVHLLRTAARLAALALPPIAALSGWPVPAWSLLLGFLAGEALDRAGFYEGFEVPSPTAQLSGWSADPA